MKQVGLAALAIGALLLPVGSVSATATWKQCGSWDGVGTWGYQGPGFGHFNVRALKVSCLTARRIVRRQGQWESEPDPNMGPHGGGVSYGEGRYRDWHCEYRFVLPEATKHRCLAPRGRRVKWLSGA
jgi:hypothetical protein